MATADRLMDADTFLARPPTRFREELIDGRVVVSEPTMWHQLVAQQLAFALRRWIDEGGGTGVVVGSVDMRVSDHDVLSPDVLWYADPDRTELRAPAQLQPPDLVAEVRSPSTWHYDVGVKSEHYAGWGVGELWLVDSDARTVLVRRRVAPGAPRFDVELEALDTLASPRLPGFALPLADLFAEPHQK